MFSDYGKKKTDQDLNTTISIKTAWVVTSHSLPPLTRLLF